MPPADWRGPAAPSLLPHPRKRAMGNERPKFDKDQPSEQAGPPNPDRYTHTSRPWVEREPGTAPNGEALPPSTIDPRPGDTDMDPSELDDPMAGSPDRQPGKDDPHQRPITDNKAGG